MENLVVEKTKIVSRKAIQKAEFANAFDLLNEHYRFNVIEYKNEQFEIGCLVADSIHPQVKQNERFWKYWNFIWDFDNKIIAENLEVWGHVNYFEIKHSLLQDDVIKKRICIHINHKCQLSAYEPQSK